MPPFDAGRSYYSKAECEDALRTHVGGMRPEVVKVRSTVITGAEYPQRALRRKCKYGVP